VALPVPRVVNRLATTLWQNARLPDERMFTRQVGQALRTDFADIPNDLDFIMSQLARIPTWRELARAALGIIFGTTGLDVRVERLI
jgi:hypothetical protein